MIGMLIDMVGNSPKMLNIGREMRQAREDYGIDGKALAGKLRLDPSTVSRWETGKRVPKPREVARYLAAVEASPDLIAGLVEDVQTPDESRWLAVGMPDRHRQHAMLLEFQTVATTVITVSPLLIPGLLQTWNYAEAIMRSASAPSDEVATRVAVRVGSREVITRAAHPVELDAFIGEAVLQQQIGGPAVMAEQLRLLADLAKRDNIDLRVVPSAAGWHPGLEGPFSIAEFGDRSPIVHLENRVSGLFLHEPAEVKAYQEATEMVRDVAMSPESSSELIEDSAVRVGEISA